MNDQSTPASADDFSKPPSQNIMKWWIQAQCSGKYPERTERSGKWLFFVPREHVDHVWAAVHDALIQKRLGKDAKVSTRLGADESQRLARNGQHVICAYTYDGTKIKDILRIAHALGEVLDSCSFRTDMFWKPDEATRQGEYHASGSRASWYVATKEASAWRIKDLRVRPAIYIDQ